MLTSPETKLDNRCKARLSQTTSKRVRLGVLAIAVAVVWSTAIPGGFVWIDWSEIDQGNYRIESTQDFLAVWTKSLEQYVERRDGDLDAKGGYLRPVYALSISIDWLLWQRIAWLYHLENIFWHLLVVFGLYTLGRQLISISNKVQVEKVAFWSALIFAVHPLGVHSVTWISGRKDLLCAAFSILSLICCARSIEHGNVKSRAASALRANGVNVVYVVASVVFLWLAVFSKEQAYGVPVIATALAWFRGRDDSSQKAFNHRIGYAVLPCLWITTGFAIFYRAYVLRGLGLGDGYHTETWSQALATFSRLGWTYMARVFWPINPTIVDRWPLSQNLGFMEVVAVLAIIALALLVAYAITQRSLPALGGLWYAIWMLPTSGVLPLRHVYAERYLYPAMWGLIMFAVYFIFLAIESRPALRRFLLIAILGGLATETLTENRHWWSDEALFQRAVSQNPMYVEGRIGLAAEALKNSHFERTIQETNIALSSAKDKTFISYWSPFIAHTNVGLAYQKTGRYHDAMEHFQNALDARPMNAIAYYHLGLSAAAMQDFQRAEDCYRKALVIQPDNFLSQSNFGHVLLRLNHPLEAVQVLRPVANARPNDSINVSNLASALLLIGEFQEAENRLESLVAMHSDNAVFLAKLAWSEWKQGKWDEAKQHLTTAEMLAPDDQTVLGITQLFHRNESGLGSNRQNDQTK